MSQRTLQPSASRALAERRWFVVDADGMVLGRLATRVASVLRGKTKPTFVPHLDCGDFVVIVNADKIRLTGNKEQAKVYSRHSGFPGGIKQVTVAQMRERHPERIIEAAVTGMLPKNRLGRALATKLKVYAGPEHPHAAQNPQPLKVGD
jgi:large subunit ribosomal protein L13